MAKQTSSSELINELKKKAKGAWDSSRKAAPKAGFINLPGGIRRGVARLVGAALAKSEDKGQGTCPVVKFKFIVREPIEYEGVQQWKSHYIQAKEARSDGKGKAKSIGEVLDALSSDLQLLGVEPKGDEGLPDFDDWPEMLADLQTSRPYFYFHTWEPNDSDNVVLFFDGLCDAKTVATFEDNPTEAPDEPDVPQAVEPEAAPPKAPPARRGPPPKSPPKAPPPADVPEDIPEAVDEVVEEPAAKAIPEVGDRCYCQHGNDQLIVDITEVNEDQKFVIVKVDDTVDPPPPAKHQGKKYKMSFEKLEKDNPSD